MSNHREIFNQLLTESGYSGRDASHLAGMNESRMSRFRNGKLDLEAGEFFQMLDQFPKEFRDKFWGKFAGVDGVCGGWRSWIKSANHDDMEEILILLAEQYSVLKKQNIQIQTRKSTVRDTTAVAV